MVFSPVLLNNEYVADKISISYMHIWYAYDVLNLQIKLCFQASINCKRNPAQSFEVAKSRFK